MTAAEINAARTAKGGWTRKTLAGWGVPWPPPKGWRQRLIAAGQPPADAILYSETNKQMSTIGDRR